MPIVLKSGNLNVLEPSGPVQACNEIALPFAFACNMYGAEAKFIHNLAGKSERRQLGTSRRRREIPKMGLRRNRVGGNGLESYNPG